MAVHIKVTGAWRTASPHVKVGGAWVRPLHIHVKQGGAWKPLWSYAWQTGTWSACSASCGGGTQTRDVTCRRSDGVYLPDAYCAGITKPATSTACNTQACYTYIWNYPDNWTACPTTCGTGSQSKTAYCRRNDGVTVADSFCSGSAPTITQSCGNCDNCADSDLAIVYAKIKQMKATTGTTYTYAEMRTLILKDNPTIIYWWNAYGRSEGVCPYNSIYCCQYDNYPYYYG